MLEFGPDGGPGKTVVIKIPGAGAGDGESVADKPDHGAISVIAELRIFGAVIEELGGGRFAAGVVAVQDEVGVEGEDIDGAPAAGAAAFGLPGVTEAEGDDAAVGDGFDGGIVFGEIFIADGRFAVPEGEGGFDDMAETVEIEHAVFEGVVHMLILGAEAEADGAEGPVAIGFGGKVSEVFAVIGVAADDEGDEVDCSPGMRPGEFVAGIETGYIPFV